MLDILKYSTIIKQNEHIKKQTCPFVTLSFMLMHSSDRLYLRYYITAPASATVVVVGGWQAVLQNIHKLSKMPNLDVNSFKLKLSCRLPILQTYQTLTKLSVYQLTRKIFIRKDVFGDVLF